MTTLTLRTRTNAGDTTSPTALTMEQVDDNFIALKNNKAEVNSPEFTGIPKAPTPTGTNVTAIANVQYVQQQMVDPIPMAIALG